VEGSLVRPVCHVLEGAIVENDRLARSREPNVELEPVGALGERALEGIDGVLGRPAFAPTAAMPEDRSAL